MDKVDILISGGGIAGLTAAAAFGAAGFSVICVDPAPPVTERDTKGADLRSTAFLQPARDLLEKCGLWERLAPNAMPLQTMRIIDAGGGEAAPRLTRDFDADEISDQPFGWNLPNWLLRREMLAHVEAADNVTFRPGIGTAGLLTRDIEARVRLSDGGHVAARLVIAADGRNSPIREAAGIGVRTTRYGQKALAFAVTHPVPHGNVSTEIHRSGGPFTLVPLPDHDGMPSSAVVWMERGPEAQRLAALNKDAFNEALNARSCHVLGPLTLASQIGVWPIISQIADRYAAQRTALIAEAAHVMPPIGAQGLNTSLADLRALLDLAEKSPDTLGDTAMLDAYHRARHTEVAVRMQGIDLLNRASMMDAQPLRDARAMGLNALHALAPVRRGLMRLGLGGTRD
ncbi:2-octaprenyl-6-methoxyphenol hydroxylase [Roseovarius nanhaiticus]|uniref:2-octaprenyl-6-methoxyphenol hydroxylase n=1 Tax=Roseovarius nanhaiticus TaxID=573024 RepID=A0A1N7EU55_9RHOB|nr:UbiH/UbiF family hydroxylase [Roseovarius nanhaiticus]SEK66758.1 2-octaprenyl-6-methoxyphenol hydroxylase [Roseovarius nanhaiticus]SIR91534.1 2-octaprenyl-6-methoxyphenol hydroxylase [Roseovarius nanhaiticus]